MTTATQLQNNATQLQNISSYCYNSLPELNFKQAARNLSSIMVPMVTLAALASIPTVEGWFGSDGQIMNECMLSCDRMAADAQKLLCYTMCWVFS